MVKIGELTEIFSKTIIIHENKEVWIDFEIESWKINIKLVHKTVDGQGGVTIEGKGSFVEITLINFDHALGIATTQPIQFAFTQKKNPIFLTAAEVLIGGSIRKLDVQFLIGDVK